MVHNFNSGPSVLPREVMEEASRAILDFNNSGLSILEIGHRTPLFQAVMDEAIALVKELHATGQRSRGIVPARGRFHPVFPGADEPAE